MDTRGWIERFDELEEKADAELMPLIVGLRCDMELFAAAAREYVRVIGLAAKQKQQVLDAEAYYAEHNL